MPQNLVTYTQERLSSLFSKEECRGLTQIILEEVVGSFASALRYKISNLTESQLFKLEDIVVRLLKGEPIQYVLGETDFYGMKMKVDSSVLIPRPETEELVQWIIEENKGKSSLKILDIGTGSGCIAITLAKFLPSAEVYAWDISPESISTASVNAEINGVNIAFECRDIFDDFPKDIMFDLIVSNPPYIEEREMNAMERNVLDYEPFHALFVPNNEPMLFYDRIADIANVCLKSGGELFFEISNSKGVETCNMLREKDFKDVILRKDFFDNDRMVKAIKL